MLVLLLGCFGRLCFLDGIDMLKKPVMSFISEGACNRNVFLTLSLWGNHSCFPVYEAFSNIFKGNHRDTFMLYKIYTMYLVLCGDKLINENVIGFHWILSKCN